MKHSRILSILLTLLVSSVALAQKSINSHTFSFSDTLETVQVEDAMGPKSELAKHRLLLRGSYDFIDGALSSIDSTRKFKNFDIVERLHSISAGAGYMFTKRFLVGFEVPVEYVHLSNKFLTNYSIKRDATKWVLGDISLHAKLRLTSDDSRVNFAIMPYVMFPTGNANYFVSDDSYAFGGKLLADTTILNGILTLYGNAGYTYAGHAEFKNIDRTKRIELAAGAYAKVIGDRLGVNAEVINAITFPGFEKDQNPINIRLGARVRTGVLRWFVGGAFEGIQNARSSNIALYAGVKMPFGSWKPAAALAAAPVLAPVEPAPVVEPTPAPLPVEKQIQILKENLSVRREVNFETNKAVILPSSYPELDSAAEIINKYAEHIGMIEIEGHTDSRASAAYNQKLSQNRANAVKEYLVNKGVPASKLKAIGYGESRLKVKETSPETLLINRRVEFKVNETIETKKEITVPESK